MSEARVWELSVGQGNENFYVSCPYPLSEADVTDVLEFFEIIRRQISRDFAVKVAKPESTQELHQIKTEGN